MKKFTVVAMVAALMMAGSAFAVQRHLTITPNATFANATGPSTTNNDDSCDIGVAPAATLLLPYFEVDFVSAATTARTTLFTITNTSAIPQVAHVVLWTDWSFAALDFNIFLTGYDVQSINLWDIFNRGIIAPGAIPGVTGSTSGTDVRTTAPGLGVGGNPVNATPRIPNATSNPNFIVAGAEAVGTLCQAQPGVIPTAYLADLQRIFTTGQPGVIIGAGCVPPASTRLGGVHANAVGYVTVDVAATCTTSLPGPGYFTTYILFDNVLIGDYQDLNPNPATGNYAGGNPMVHIRAIPEGGPAGSTALVGTNLPFTFYDRYTGLGSGVATVARVADRRQPLPSVFAARFIQGGTGAFNTNYKIWREGITGPSGTACNASSNSALTVSEIVRFDEHENATTSSFSTTPISPPPTPTTLTLPETSSTSTSNTSVFPSPSTSGDVAGWMYLNLNHGGSTTGNLSAQRAAFTTTAGAVTYRNVSQNWVIISMFAEGRFSVDFDAAWLGNGCSGAVAVGATVGPVGGTPVCPAAAAGCVPGSALYPGTNVTP